MIRFLSVISLLLFFGSSAMAGGIDGVWRSETNQDGYIFVQISPCETNYCGVIIKAFDVEGKPAEYKYLGKQMIWDMKDGGNGEFSGGKIFAPDRERTFDGQLKLVANGLVIRGCALGGLVCKQQLWSRVPESELQGQGVTVAAE